jgi:hypothetical protein
MARYADCPTVEVETVVDAPPSAVWPFVTDINLPAQFSSEFQGATWIDEGKSFVGRNAHPAGGEWETTSYIVEFEDERRFGWAVMSVDTPSASWRFSLEPSAGGRATTLRQWARMGPGPSGLTPAIKAMPDKEERIVARRLEEWRTNMQATVDGIKAMAEGAEDP